MSLDCIAWAFDQQDVPTTQRYVLVRLAWHADRNTSTCYPSLTHLAKKTGFNRSTVARSINWLEENGYVERIGLHRGRSMTYRLRAAERDQSQTATSQFATGRFLAGGFTTGRFLTGGEEIRQFCFPVHVRGRFRLLLRFTAILKI